MQLTQVALIRTNKTFTKKNIKRYGTPKMLAQLHNVANKAFELPTEINNSTYLLNNFLYNQSIFAFSFVRHPYER